MEDSKVFLFDRGLFSCQKLIKLFSPCLLDATFMGVYLCAIVVKRQYQNDAEVEFRVFGLFPMTNCTDPMLWRDHYCPLQRYVQSEPCCIEFNRTTVACLYHDCRQEKRDQTWQEWMIVVFSSVLRIRESRGGFKRYSGVVGDLRLETT
jgi:hypothetical protein